MGKNETDLMEIVLFNVAGVLCGLSISNVLEIKKLDDVTTVYGAPEVVKGVINLRGQIVTVLDLRKRFAVEEQELATNERVVIVPFNDEQVGLLVDSVNDVIQVERSAILPVPPNMDHDFARFFNSVYQWESEIISLVDLEQIVNVDSSYEESVIGG